MIHKITIRDLNNLGNQLPFNNPVRKIIHKQVLEAMDKKSPFVKLRGKRDIRKKAK